MGPTLVHEERWIVHRVKRVWTHHPRWSPLCSTLRIPQVKVLLRYVLEETPTEVGIVHRDHGLEVCGHGHVSKVDFVADSRGTVRTPRLGQLKRLAYRVN